jgi:uncharacterized protein (TIGR04255 family)
MKIDLTEQFRHLSRAPIVEAVIEIRARAEIPWVEQAVSEALKAKLPDYPQFVSQNEVKQEVSFDLVQGSQAKQHDLGWKGLRLQSGDGRHVAQFNRDGFLFSRLHPYESWEKLQGEALRLWGIYCDLARPTETQRTGLRFINRFTLPAQETRFEDYVEPHAKPPRNLDLPFLGFFHQDTLAVPGYPYALNVVRTVQPPQDLKTQGLAIILDIDVFTIHPLEIRMDQMNKWLTEMRWLKNKVFFGSVTEKALESFK